jgi:CheY-like chemotaxis protein
LEAPAEDPAPADLIYGKGERILLVDDEPAVLESVESLLNRLGYAVTSATNGREAWEIFRAHPEAFDLVFTDHVMPGITGVQLAKKLLGARPDLPIILATGYSEEATEEEVKALGIREFLLKPSTAQAMSQLVHSVLKKQG